MKIIEIAGRVDKSKENESWTDTEDIGSELDIDVPCVEQDRLKCFWVGNWYCTDSYVGYRMYFLDDEPVAFSVQEGRKCNENFHWFSRESAKKVKEYLQSLVLEKEEELNISICDVNEEIGENFKIYYNNQILKNNKVTFNGEKVTIIERIINKPYGIDNMLKIQLPNGETEEVYINELDFGFHIL